MATSFLCGGNAQSSQARTPSPAGPLSPTVVPEATVDAALTKTVSQMPTATPTSEPTAIPTPAAASIREVAPKRVPTLTAVPTATPAPPPTPVPSTIYFPMDDPTSPLPVTGSGMDIFDKAIPELMERWGIPGGAVALVKDGRLLLAKGYGWSDVAAGEPVLPDSLFRTAGVSMPVTAAAPLGLVEDGALDLDDRAFRILGQLGLTEGTDGDPRVDNITVRHLLRHSGGWNRATSGDPTWQPGKVAAELDAPKPVGCREFLRYALGRPLDFDPGTKYAFASLGYCALGHVIEETTGLSYEEYVKQRVLEPASINRMRIGGTRLRERAEGEVRYYLESSDEEFTSSVFPDGPRSVPRPYGGYYVAGRDSAGGWIASPIDLVRFVTALDGSRAPSVLRPETVDLMLSRPAPPLQGGSYYYGMGWGVTSSGEDASYGHNGSQPGVRSSVRSTQEGLTWAVLFNLRPGGPEFRQELNDVLWSRMRSVSAWPTHDLFPQHGYPGTPSSVTWSGLEREALVALYNATGGADWTNNENWLSDAPISRWHGVTTDSRDRVIELRLSGNGLNGELPAELGNLTHLELLFASRNELRGEIPSQLGRLSMLRALSLYDNRLSGPVPSWLGNLSRLQWIRLSENLLTGKVPAELGDLINLERLALSDNQLTGEIPGELGRLSSLELLSISGNQLTGGIPSRLAGLTNLKLLSLSGNRLTGTIPPWLGSLSGLELLRLSDNRLVGTVPAELGDLANLKLLVLAGNQLVGCIPESLLRVSRNDLPELALPYCDS